MPRIPKWLGDTMETVFSRMMLPVCVTNVDYLAPDLKKISMSGDLSKMKYSAGNVIEFRVSETEFRHYTISHFDKEKGICHMLVYLHNRGAGSDWIRALKAGDTARLMGPGGRINYKENNNSHFVFGDETSLGFMQAMSHQSRRSHHKLFCLAELEPEHSTWPAAADIQAEIVTKDLQKPAKHAVEKLMDPDFFKSWRQSVFYLTGRAKSIQSVRKVLLQHGVAMRNIVTEPYWAEGKQGL